MFRFVDQVASTGASIALLPEHDPSVSRDYCATYKSIKNELELVHCEAVAKSPNISENSALSLVERLNNEEDVYCSRKEFTEKPAVKQVYHNLEKITRGKTVDEALQKMREHEFTRYTDILGGSEEDSSDPTSYVKEGRDLLNERRTYAYHAHCLAIGLLRRCGFQCIRNKNSVHDELLERNIRELLPALKKHMDKFLYEFESRRKGATPSYTITQNSVGKLFVYSERDNPAPDDSDKPIIYSSLEKIPSPVSLPLQGAA
ncbi:hypothetical protein GLOIN_2v1488959 [Rhizophagus irregularis DAOM 181602=DAOM 197198]|nr:hypothetical protein GLOIN_2v1488959 [Rhizophagus irregularis DAOM 181602=DAOM 197198]